ncbi:probable protein phosphatase 2C 24 [Andrographis paniculata]|uniref:probable protein phosphatase 2C 24 n=1 Tax=Andrographis paniculata TaxID=175694 RepID=UPI0021E73134|nr:probable protein phosphatase 2C 24 [Andrographis paniculata]
MAEICCGVMAENEASGGESRRRTTRRRRMELRRVRIDQPREQKRRRFEMSSSSRDLDLDIDLDSAVEACGGGEAAAKPSILSSSSQPGWESESLPKFGIASVCGRRRDMEDAVAIQPSFFRRERYGDGGLLHYYGVYDGHGCSHVATKCKERLHDMVREELAGAEEIGAIGGERWRWVMEQSFNRMDGEVIAWSENFADDDNTISGNCRCELRTPECDAVGTTAVVAVVTPDEIIVANCGDSRAVLCRNGAAVPLSTDHKPDRPDELSRIQSAGGRVIYWEGARVLGVLAMSRAIGDNYLKPYVSCVPEVSVTERGGGDEFLILASDGLWDVVSNATACGVARMCLKGGGGAASPHPLPEENSDKACRDASLMLTKLALARGSADNVSVVVIDLT